MCFLDSEPPGASQPQQHQATQKRRRRRSLTGTVPTCAVVTPAVGLQDTAAARVAAVRAAAATERAECAAAAAVASAAESAERAAAAAVAAAAESAGNSCDSTEYFHCLLVLQLLHSHLMLHTLLVLDFLFLSVGSQKRFGGFSS